ncbi:MAG: uracil-DNA glycosylase [Paraglaciecola sp.]|jgi:uracil-DNA glycosylase
MTTWTDILAAQKQLPYFKAIVQHVDDRRGAGIEVFPPQQDVFKAFDHTPFDQVKVVILGQDPYHGPNQAHGLSFSVQAGVKKPPSLVNIYKELARDIPGFVIPGQGCLQSWAEQGVLLLNTVLTVEQGQAHSHAKIGWEQFSDAVIQQLSEHRQGLIFLLWGNHAQRKGQAIDASKHHVLQAPHPSPLSAHRGFLGCRHFSVANQLLREQGLAEINWQV